MKLLWLLLIAVLPCQAAMTVTRELIAPEQLAPGQPVRVAVTFWTDSWFNPAPKWPDFTVANGSLLTTALPNQLLTRQEGGVSWSGIRMERQVSAWDQGMLRMPALELTLSSAGQPPVTVKLPALEHTVSWPKDVQQPDRFLPASHLSLKQKITLYHSDNAKVLRAGDVIERQVTVAASDVTPTQIPPLLYAIPGTNSQQLPPNNQPLISGRGDVSGSQRVETIRYLPVEAGTVTLPPVKLRWWDTVHQQWRTAAAPGAQFHVMASKTAGAEQALKGQDNPLAERLIALATLITFSGLAFLFRRTLLRSGSYLRQQWRRVWRPTALPGPVPDNKRH